MPHVAWAIMALLLLSSFVIGCGSSGATTSSTNKRVPNTTAPSTEAQKTVAPTVVRKQAPLPSALTTDQLQAIIDQVKQLDEPSTAQAPQFTGTPSTGTMYDFIQVVMNDVDGFWRQTFAQSGIAYSSPSFVVLDQGDAPEASYCSGSLADANAGPFYCPRGGQFGNQGTRNTPIMYFGAPWLYTSMSQVQPDNFDFAVASVVAHEFGHHIQYLLLQAGLISADALPGKWRELSADCLSGVWANAAYYKGELQDTDVEEAEQAAWNAGSDLPDDTGVDPHGMREERFAAFKYGYDNGDTVACLS